MRVSPVIDTNDLKTKINQATKFLKSGDKVKVTMRFRGREMSYMDNGFALLDKFASNFTEIASVEKPPAKEGRSIIMFLAPKN